MNDFGSPNPDIPEYVELDLHVFRKSDGTFWFEDETQGFVGPWRTARKARRMLELYCWWYLGSPLPWRRWPAAYAFCAWMRFWTEVKWRVYAGWPQCRAGYPTGPDSGVYCIRKALHPGPHEDFVGNWMGPNGILFKVHQEDEG